MTQHELENRLERYRWTQAVWGWSYTFARPSPVVSCQTFGLEIGVVLAGTRAFETPHRGSMECSRGQISVFDLGEPYVTGFTPHGEVGREIGFVVRSELVDGWSPPGRVLAFPRRAHHTDVPLLELAISLADSLDRGEQLRPLEIEAEVRAFVERHAELVEADAIEMARRELHRTFDRPLYMRHFAAIAGVHEETFARKFAARYGVTPAKYRVLVRLKEAAMLVGTRPDLSLRDVAKKVGFEDVAYFHRAFVAQYGTTPMTLARQFTGFEAA